MAIYKHVVGGPQGAGDQWTTSLHTSGTGTLASAQTAWLAFLTDVCGPTNLGSLWSTAVKVRDVTTYTINALTGHAQAVARGSGSIDGTGGTTPGSPRDSIVAGLRTAVPGKTGRGRMYWPGADTANLDVTGLLEDAAKTLAAGAIAAALADLATAGFQPIVWSVPNPAGTPITGVTVSAVQGSQRRRTNKIPPQYAAAIL